MFPTGMFPPGMMYLVVIVIFWSINPFLKKNITNKLSSIEYSFGSNIIIITLLTLYILYNNNYTKNSIIRFDFYNKLNNKELILLFVSVCCTLIPSILFIKALRIMEVSYVNAFTNSMSIVLASAIGIYFFNETINRNVFLGISSILLGISLLSNK